MGGLRPGIEGVQNNRGMTSKVTYICNSFQAVSSSSEIAVKRKESGWRRETVGKIS
jgi:hypothetical protein